MRRRRRSIQHGGSVMVPMADMISNTVGVMLFIMAFMVLQTGGTLIPRKLPMEQSSDARPVYILCRNNQLFPMNDDLTDKLIEPLGTPRVDKLDKWMHDFNESRVEDEYFIVRGEGEAGVRPRLSVRYDPKKGAGLTLADIFTQGSALTEILTQAEAENRFVFFIVDPREVELFREARQRIMDHYNLGAGWGPIDHDAPVRISLTGGGIAPRPQ